MENVHAPDAWLTDPDPDITTLPSYHQRILKEHQADERVPPNNCARHQWHYTPSQRLLGLVQAWHSEGALVHLTYADTYYDTPDKTLATQFNARLMHRWWWDHSERRLRHNERWEWILTWFEDSHATDGSQRQCIAEGMDCVVRTLGDWSAREEEDAKKIKEQLCNDQGRLSHAKMKMLVQPSYTCRYVPKLDYECSNPRWWLEVQEKFLNPDDVLHTNPLLEILPKLYRSQLTVEADPITERWNSDDDEAEDHNDPECTWTPWSLTQPLTLVATCRTCHPVRLPEKVEEQPMKALFNSERWADESYDNPW